MDPDARFRSPVALRAARRDHTTLDVVLLSALLVLSAIVWSMAHTPTTTSCDGFSPLLCAAETTETARPS